MSAKRNLNLVPGFAEVKHEGYYKKDGAEA